MSGVGVRRDLVLNVTISLYISKMKISPVLTNIYCIPEKIWVPWALWSPPPLFCHIKCCEDPKIWPLGPIFYTLPKVVPMSLIMWIQWNLLQNRPESDFWPNFAPLRGQIGPKHIAPGEPKFYTLPTVVLVNLKKTSFVWIQRKPFAK